MVSGQAARGSGQGKTQVAPLHPGVNGTSSFLALVIVAIITQIPFVFTVPALSFLNWNLTRPDLGRTFTGLGNYVLELSRRSSGPSCCKPSP